MVDVFGPFIVASKSVSLGHGDLLTIIDQIVGKDYGFRLVIASLLLLLNIAVVARFVRQSKD